MLRTSLPGRECDATPPANSRSTPGYLAKFTAQKVQALPGPPPEDVADSLAAWMARYLTFALVEIRSPAVVQKTVLQLKRFIAFFQERYGHDRISTTLRRDVLAWQQQLVIDGFAPATVNNHLAALSAFTTWVHVQAPTLLPMGYPAKGCANSGCRRSNRGRSRRPRCARSRISATGWSGSIS